MDYTRMGFELERLLGQVKQSTLDFLPNLIGALIIILTGILLAFFLRALIRRLTKSLDRFVSTEKIRNGLKHIGIERSASEMIGSVIFWIVLIFFLTAATETLGLPVVTTWLSGIAMYLPRILAAILICLVGLAGGVLLRDIIIGATLSTGITYGNILAKLTQSAVVLISLLVAIEHIGISISVLTSVISIIIGAVLFGMALAFGLGARASISNILASHYLQKTYRIGHQIKIDNATGRIVQITPTAVILETAEGQVLIPANIFSERTSMLVVKEEG
jgi:hypothetical protein